MSSIRKRPNGSWRARYRDADGKEHARHFPRKIDAQNWLDTVTASVVRGDYVDPNAGKVTFRDFYASWSPLQLWESGTRENMDLVAKQATFGDMELRMIRRTHVEAWIKTMVSNGMAPRTVHTRASHARSVFRAAVRDRVIPMDPSEGVTLPRVRRAEHAMQIPTAEQVGALYRAADPWFRVVIGLGAFAGLRIGESNGVQLRDVDFLKRTLHVARQVQRRSPGPVEVRPPKYGSERTVHLPDGLLHVVSWHLEHVGAYGDDDWLLPGKDNGPAWPRKVAGAWEKTVKAAAVGPITSHALRHYYASGLIAAGCDVVTVQRALGHRSASVTLNTYSHLWPSAEDRTRTAAQGLLGDALGDPADYLRTGEG